MLTILEHCEQLSELIGDWEKQNNPAQFESDHPRDCVPTAVQEGIVSWLGGIDLVSDNTYTTSNYCMVYPDPDLQEHSRQLIHDKEELLGQVVSLQQQLEISQEETSKLSAKVTTIIISVLLSSLLI